MCRLSFVRHRTANQIRATYRASRHPVEKTRRHAVWLLARTDEQLQPVEPFWVLVREAVANDACDRLADSERVARRRCRRLAGDRAAVKGAVGFQWAAALEG